MPIDHRMILNNQQQPSVMDSYQKVMSIKNLAGQSEILNAQKQDLLRKDQERKTIRDLYSANISSDDSGATTLNRKGFISGLAKVNPELALKKNSEFRGQDIQALKQDADLKKNLAWSIRDPISYQQVREKALKLGIPGTERMPLEYDPQFVNQMQYGTLTAQEQIDRQYKQQQLALKKEELGMKRVGKQKIKKKLSPTEAKQKGLYELGVDAEKQFRAAVSSPGDYDPTQTGQFIDNSEWAPNFIKNDKAIEAQAAQANWVEAFLRDASGAAIPPSERMAYAKDFFPSPGDTPKVVENKRQLRERKMENARIAAGGDRTTPRASLSPEELSQKRQSRIAELRAKKNRVAGN